MKLLPALLAIAAFACLPLAASIEECADTAASCDDACQTYDCMTNCNANGIACIAPGSSCAQQYRQCVGNCPSSPRQQMESCRMACLENGHDCAVDARGSGGGGCCGGFIILLAAGSGILLARRF